MEPIFNAGELAQIKATGEIVTINAVSPGMSQIFYIVFQNGKKNRYKESELIPYVDKEQEIPVVSLSCLDLRSCRIPVPHFSTCYSDNQNRWKYKRTYLVLQSTDCKIYDDSMVCLLYSVVYLCTFES